MKMPYRTNGLNIPVGPVLMSKFRPLPYVVRNVGRVVMLILLVRRKAGSYLLLGLVNAGTVDLNQTG